MDSHCTILPTRSAVTERCKVAVRVRVLVGQICAKRTEIMRASDHRELMQSKRVPLGRRKAQTYIENCPNQKNARKNVSAAQNRNKRIASCHSFLAQNWKYKNGDLCPPVIMMRQQTRPAARAQAARGLRWCEISNVLGAAWAIAAATATHASRTTPPVNM